MAVRSPAWGPGQGPGGVPAKPRLGKAERLNQPPLLRFSDERQRNSANLKALKFGRNHICPRVLSS